MTPTYSISGNIIDIHHKSIYKGVIYMTDGKIDRIEMKDDVEDHYILPGFIDAHIHIESSMVTPYEFARVALGHGTVATVSDPHEIANVCGIPGVQYMIDNAKDAKLKFHFGAPSCVPATSFENAGAVINAKNIDTLMASDDIWYLSEMMNYPGVLNNDEEILAKIASAQKYQKPVDGHAPGLKGDIAQQYIAHGISTDHECFTLAEALDKLKYGMKIIIREGSAAKNFEALHPLIASHPDKVMFCSDDKHPDDLIDGHINLLIKRALGLGYDLFDVLRIACLNPVNHYQLPVGLLQPGDPADCIIVEDTKDWKIKSTYINGEAVFQNGYCTLPDKSHKIINQFDAKPVYASDFEVAGSDSSTLVIQAIDGSLVTEKMACKLSIKDGKKQMDKENDILKIVVINRYQSSKPAVGFIHHFGLKGCAIASTVAHDSHNIIAVGDDEHLITQAVNLLIQSQGGLSAVSHTDSEHIPLPIAGLMSDLPVDEIGHAYENISTFAKKHGCQLHAPFMTLSFMALLVIPKIKISDLGMFDAENFQFYQ
jgi:adenine deaminase